MKRYIRYACYLSVVVFTGAASPAAAAVAVPDLLTQLFRVAAGGTAEEAYIAHPDFVLLRHEGRVRTTVEGAFHPGSPVPPGVTVIAARAGGLETWCTPEGLAALAADDRTAALHPPFRFVPLAVESEAAGVMGWDAYHALGATGEGIRLAIIDVDFSGHQALLGTELPPSVVTRSFVDPTLEPYREKSYHGTAVAEIIHDIAPDAELFLLTILEQRDFSEAVTWCIDNDIAVVNMSLGFFGGPRDGTSSISTEVDRAAAAGILWFNSAGNSGSSHWGGPWTDSDQDDYLEFAPGREVIGFTYLSPIPGSVVPLVAQLIWDRWPTSTGLRLDVELYRDSTRNLLEATSNSTPSADLAYRVVTLDNPVAGTRYFLAVKRQAGTITAPLRLDLFNDDGAVDMVPRDSFGSLLIPADARGAIAVGAYDFSVTTPGADPVRFYSSRGPTWDGRRKPDLVAADGVSTFTYGNHGFYGTSASTPHAAGAAALLASATVSGGLFTYVWDVGDLLQLLAVRSIDFGPAGPDSTYGLGAIVLPPASSRPEDFAVTAYPNPFNADLVIAFAARPGEGYEVRIYDLLGRPVWQTRGTAAAGGEVRITWPGSGSNGRGLASGTYFYRVETTFGRRREGRAVLLK